MRATRDSFLHFLADNLGSVPVHNIRIDKDNPSSELIQANCVNVQFLNLEFDTQESGVQVAIDVVHEDELIALDWTQQVVTLLFSALMTPKLDYTNANPNAVPPVPPTPVGHNLYWGSHVRFKPVIDRPFTRFNGLLTIKNRVV